MRFFVLEAEPVDETMKSGMMALKDECTQRGAAPQCPSCGRYLGMREWLSPHRIEVEIWGQGVADLLPVISDIVVSDRFKTFWASSGLSGLSSFSPVEIARAQWYGGKRTVLPSYFHAKIARSRTAIDVNASGFEWDVRPTCDECRLGDNVQRWQRLVIENGTWDGEDLFFARGLPGSILMTDRVKQLCEDRNLKTPMFIPIEDHKYDVCKPFP